MLPFTKTVNRKAFCTLKQHRTNRKGNDIDRVSVKPHGDKGVSTLVHRVNGDFLTEIDTVNWFLMLGRRTLKGLDAKKRNNMAEQIICKRRKQRVWEYDW